MPPMDEIDAPDHPATLRVSVTPADSELNRIALGGTLLLILTFGLYRFWFITRIRRYFWSRIHIDRYPLDYDGEALELIAGLAFAIAILLPVYLILFLASLGLVGLTVEINLFGFLLLLYLSQMAIYRARRYRLRRTTWRGLRFDQIGQGFQYAAIATAGYLINLVTLGLSLPVLRQSLYRFRTNRTFFGNLRASFDARLGPLYRAFLPLCVSTWTLALITLWIDWINFRSGVLTIWDAWDGIQSARVVLSEPSYILRFIAPAVIWLALVGIIIFPILGSHYLAAEHRHFAGHTRFGLVRLKSELKTGDLVRIWARYLPVVAALAVGVAVVFSVVVLANGGLSSTILALVDDAKFRWIFAIGVGALYVSTVFGISVLHLKMVSYPLWRTKANALSLEGEPSWQSIVAGTATTEFREGRAEGLADALDAGGF